MRAASIPTQYQRPFLEGIERSFLNCLRGSAALGAVFLIVVYVVPQRTHEIESVDEIPERFARLILEEPAPVPVQIEPAAPEGPAVETPPEVVEPPKPVVKPTPTPRRTPKVVPKDKGRAGRERAKTQVAKNLASVEKSLDSAISKLSTSLPASDKSSTSKPRRGRRRAVRSARGSSDVASIGSASSGAGADLNSSAVGSELVAIDAIEDIVATGDLGGAGGGGTGGSGSGDLRSNSSLLAVVRRYAAGIQYCYDEELKSSPNLKGKMVVSITVAANGQVTNAKVVEDGLRSSSVRDCVLSQIRGWKFGRIEQGAVTFKTPFVFTPPK